MKMTETLILGASALAAGYADSSCVVADGGILIGGEFANALHGFGTPPSQPRSEKARAFYRTLETRGLLTSGLPVHLPGVQPVLAKIYKESGARMLLSARLTELSRVEEHFRAVFFTTAGFLTLNAARVLDTTSGVGMRALGYDVGAFTRTLACLLLSADPAAPLPVIKGAEVNSGLYPGLCAAHFPFTGSLTDEQEAVDAAVANLSPWRRAAVAHLPDVTPARAGFDADGFLWRPSAYYNDPISAFDAGTALREGGMF
jgi:hypothetical protein